MSTYYKQLTQEQRYQIYALKKAGHGQMEIANIVDVHKSTISRRVVSQPWSARVPTKASAQVCACAAAADAQAPPTADVAVDSGEVAR